MSSSVYYQTPFQKYKKGCMPPWKKRLNGILVYRALTNDSTILFSLLSDQQRVCELHDTSRET